jgi:hypothetical protein
MQLGELLSHLDDESHAAAALNALGDIVLYARVEAAGRDHDEQPGEYVTNAARRFAAVASDEEWLAVMNALERTDDPARAVLLRMLDWELTRDAAVNEPASPHACTCGGQGHGHP